MQNFDIDTIDSVSKRLAIQETTLEGLFDHVERSMEAIRDLASRSSAALSKLSGQSAAMQSLAVTMLLTILSRQASSAISQEDNSAVICLTIETILGTARSLSADILEQHDIDGTSLKASSECLARIEEAIMAVIRRY